MDMLKTPARILTALNRLDSQARKDPLYLDPVTTRDKILRSFAMIFLMGFLYLGFQFTDVTSDPMRVVPTILILMILLPVLLTINEFWMVDFENRCLRFQRTFVGLCYTLKTVPFDDLLTLAVSGHLHSRKSNNTTTTWWEHGIAILSKDGTNHSVFPNLSRKFETACEVAEKLAQVLDLPLMEPQEESRLAVENQDGVPTFKYRSKLHDQIAEQVPLETLLKKKPSEEELVPYGEPNRETQVSSPEVVSTLQSPERASWPQTSDRNEVVEKLSGQPMREDPIKDVAPDKYEVVEEQSRGGQLGCALFGLMFMAPFGLGGIAFLYEAIVNPSVASIAVTIVLGLPAIWCTWYLGYWAINPIVKQVTYIDRSRIASLDQVRSLGQHKVQEVIIPHDAKVRVFEGSTSMGSSGQRSLDWMLTIRSSDGTHLFDLPRPKSREEAVREAQRVAEVLDIEVEIKSEFT